MSLFAFEINLPLWSPTPACQIYIHICSTPHRCCYGTLEAKFEMATTEFVRFSSKTFPARIWGWIAKKPNFPSTLWFLKQIQYPIYRILLLRKRAFRQWDIYVPMYHNVLPFLLKIHHKQFYQICKRWIICIVYALKNWFSQMTYNVTT